MSFGSWSTQQCLLGLSAAMCGLIIVLGGVPSRAFSEPLVLNPTLSLTGSCKTSETDPVPDPNCPEGLLPPESFSNPKSVTTDAYGNIFVASYGQTGFPELGVEGRVDIFDSSGHFIYEKLIPEGPSDIVVDKSGNLYVIDTEKEILRFPPSVYEPATHEIEYAKPFEVVAGKSPFVFIALAVSSINQHLFANYGNGATGTHAGEFITEFGSAEEGNPFLGTIGKGTLENPYGIGLAIDSARKRIYASDREPAAPGEPFGSGPPVVQVFNLEPPHELLETIDGSSTPEGKFLSDRLSVAVDESTGNVFVYDGEGSRTVYELTESGGYLSTIDHNFKYTDGAEISVDNGEHSPNGALNPLGRYLYVPSHPTSIGHSFAFGPSEIQEPVIESATIAGVTDREAKLEAKINPRYLSTTYTFEYTTEQNYEEEGESFAGAQVIGTGEVPAQGSPAEVAAALEGLESGTEYRFRVIAVNEQGSDELERRFSTYPEAEPLPPFCENASLRTGFSALLPDCRAYELVTPSDTNARAPIGVGHLGTYFATREASPTGGKASFEIEGGSIPGFEATGSFAGDPYLATRSKEGWETSYVGPTGAESPAALPGSNSPDQGYSLWSTGNGSGSAALGGITAYLRYPDGHSALVGRGSLGIDPRALGRLISEDGHHVIFESGASSSAVQLEPNAPPDGTRTVYDRTIDAEGSEETHTVSLLPGDVTPSAGQNALYQGASLDGNGVAFSIGKKLYLRFDDKETYEVGENVTFAGVAEGGARIFYLEGGDLFAFDVKPEEVIQFTESGDVTPVNIAAEGTVAYFVSPGVLTGEANPNGATAQKGKENLYLSREGAISFVGTVTERDVEGESGNEQHDGLGLWTEVVGPGRLGADPSRATPDGSVLLFESRAPLTAYDPEEHPEVYRYDSVGGALDCLSCIPTKAQATGEASLESVKDSQSDPQPFSAFGYVTNLRDDGRRAFFQSTEPLVLEDTDNLQDVYEWEAQGVGSCARAGGCVYLISSGHSHNIDYLYAVSDSGDDVFFLSSDLLLPSDADETPSIYDARVGGGFPEVTEEECQGEGCRPDLTAPPSPPVIASKGIGPEPKVVHCPNGKHKVTKNGKISCVKNKKKHKHHRAGSKKKGAGK